MLHPQGATMKAKNPNLPEFLTKLNLCLDLLDAFDVNKLKRLRVALRKITACTHPEDQDDRYHMYKALLKIVSLKLTKPWTDYVETSDSEEIPF